MPPKLSAPALFRGGVALLVVGLLLPVLGQAALTTLNASQIGFVISVVVSGLVWMAQALGAALVAASLVVRALSPDPTPRSRDDVAARE